MQISPNTNTEIRVWSHSWSWSNLGKSNSCTRECSEESILETGENTEAWKGILRLAHLLQEALPEQTSDLPPWAIFIHAYFGMLSPGLAKNSTSQLFKESSTLDIQSRSSFPTPDPEPSHSESCSSTPYPTCWLWIHHLPLLHWELNSVFFPLQ